MPECPFDEAASLRELQLAKWQGLRQIIRAEGLDVNTNVGGVKCRTLYEMRLDIQAARVQKRRTVRSAEHAAHL